MNLELGILICESSTLTEGLRYAPQRLDARGEGPDLLDERRDGLPPVLDGLREVGDVLRPLFDRGLADSDSAITHACHVKNIIWVQVVVFSNNHTSGAGSAGSELPES